MDMVGAGVPVAAGVLGTGVTGTQSAIPLVVSAALSTLGYLVVALNPILDHHLALQVLALVKDGATLDQVADLVVASRSQRLRDVWVGWRKTISAG